MKYCNPSYAMKLVDTSNWLVGKKVKLFRGERSHQPNLDLKILTQKVLLTLIEDIDNQDLTSNSDIIEASFLLE